MDGTSSSAASPSSSVTAAQKRFKPIETCDNCKQRKVKCDKVRPVCGTCEKTKRECTYDFSASSKRGRPKSEFEILQEQIEDIQNTQFHQLEHYENMLEMAILRSGGIAPSAPAVPANVQELGGLPTHNGAAYGEGYLNGNENNSVQDVFGNAEGDSSPPPSLNQNLSEETLQFSSKLAANLPKTTRQTPQVDVNASMSEALAASLAMGVPGQASTSSGDPVDELTNQLNNLNIYESTRYVGEGSLLMLSDAEEEFIFPEQPVDLSQVEDYLKVLPNPETVDTLIDVYYQRVYRHYPHLRKKIVLDCLRALSKPQHFLLLNSIFFAASPLHPDENKRDGRVYHKRAVALLQRHCLTIPHVLTVISLFILGLHTRTMGSAWIFHGMASKMTFELGLHRKIKNIQMNADVKEMRDMAFWGCFMAETWVSACYGRPSAIDEATCDVDLLPIPTDPEPDDQTKLHIAWILHINLMRIFAQVRKYLYGRTRIAGTPREETQFRFLDAALGRWLKTLPQWLKFEEMAKDVKRSLLGAIGGEMHTLFWTVLILLHSRNLTMFSSNPANMTSLQAFDNPSRISSQTICIQAAIILLHWLDVLMNGVADFYEQTCTALFAIAPAIRVLSWVAQRGDKKAESMVERLKEIKIEVKEIARRRFSKQGAEGRLDGEAKLQEWLGRAKEEEAKTFQAQENEYMMLDPGQFRKMYNYKGKKPASGARRRMDSGVWNENKDNFTFTFSVNTPLDTAAIPQVSLSQQGINTTGFLAQQQTSQMPPQQQQQLLFSPPSGISASTSPHMPTSPSNGGTSSSATAGVYQSSQQPNMMSVGEGLLSPSMLQLHQNAALGLLDPYETGAGRGGTNGGASGNGVLTGDEFLNIG